MTTLKNNKLFQPENEFSVRSFPNPYNKEFNLQISTPLNGMATIEFFTTTGSKIYEMKKFMLTNTTNIIHYKGQHHSGTLMYRVTLGNKKAVGLAIGTN
jgi:hypothetical protein